MHEPVEYVGEQRAVPVLLVAHDKGHEQGRPHQERAPDEDGLDPVEHGQSAGVGEHAEG